MQDTKAIYRGQQRVIKLASLAGLILFLTITLASCQWTKIGAAQDAPTATATAATTTDTAATDARIEEISRSQDRFVQAMIGIVGVIGTVFVVLVGLNLFQNNRNFERESASIREYAQSQIDRAVSDASVQLRKLAALQAAENKEQLTKATNNNIAVLRKVASEGTAGFESTLHGIADQLSQYSVAFAKFLEWAIDEETAPLRRLPDDMSPSERGRALLDVSARLHALAMLTGGPARNHLIWVTVRSLNQAVRLINTDYGYPEDNDFWYTGEGEEAREKAYAVIASLRQQKDTLIKNGVNSALPAMLVKLDELLPAKGPRLEPAARAVRAKKRRS